MTWARIILLGAAMASAGCYESREPLSKPGEPLDAAVLGAWRCVSAEPNEDPIEVRVWRFDPAQYLLELIEKDGDTDRYQAYPSRVGGRVLLNTRDLSQPPPDRWVFLRYSLTGADALTFWLIPEEALKGVAPAQAMATIRRRAGDDALYKRIGECKRIEKSASGNRPSGVELHAVTAR